MPAEKNREELKQSITALEKECARLKEADQKFKSLFNGSMDGLVVVEGETGRIICVNRRLGEMLGYSEDALNGKTFDVMLPPKTTKPPEDLLKELQVYGGVFTQDFLHAQGNVCVVDLMATLVPWEENWAILCTLRDASGRVRLEKQLRQAQKMEAIGSLAGGVAHDLNNILSGLVSYPDLLLMDLPEESHLRKPILTIKRSGERAAAIVGDLLSLARRGLSAGEKINLNQIVSAYEGTPEQQQLQNYHPGVRVETRLVEGLLPISGSSENLSKVLANLVLNAAEAMPQGGKVRVTTENRHIDETEECHIPPETGDYAVMAVSDSGTAIPSNDLERIFEPFYTKKKMGRNDTGLGMTVVWGTVKDHGGYIDVKSEEGKGTTFTLYFPVLKDDPFKTVKNGTDHESQ
ncbi:MAG: PAS domain S-box protein [Deltaproteobacteria bacterium]|nr:PAS domain S-box protein [Deltaproteobacteria bacterium]